ncbi:MAG: exodeoxyribonuclease III [Bacteroidota bacterium]
MKIVSYNINGIRAAIGKGFIEWLESEKPDIVCLQEVKALQEQVNLFEIQGMGYHIEWFSAEKKGYSGVAILSKPKPKHVHIGVDNEMYDKEGRCIRLDFEGFSVISVYMPSGSSGDLRQEFKFNWLHYFFNYISKLKKDYPNLIICGDYNICHQTIDIHDPVRNKNSSGFLPEEREWMGKFIDSGFIDSFRHINKEPHHYSWWSYRANARTNNKGWRIDYNMVSKNLEEKIADARILKDAFHSDHCPVMVKMNF